MQNVQVRQNQKVLFIVAEITNVTTAQKTGEDIIGRDHEKCNKQYKNIYS